MTGSLRSPRLIALLMAAAFVFGFTNLAGDSEATAGPWAGQTYPNNGMLWMSGEKSYNGSVWVEFNNLGCSTTIKNQADIVWDNIEASTTGTSQMSQWTNGIRMKNSGCGFTATAGSTQGNSTGAYSGNTKDSGIFWDGNQSNFLQSNGSYIGGRIQRQAASPAFCSAWGESHPCGHRPWVQMNKVKWLNGSSSYQLRQILHETGHSHGLADRCNYGGIMMNGGSCGWNQSLTVWTSADRTDLNAVYP